MITTNLDRFGPGAGWGVDDDTDEGEMMDDQTIQSGDTVRVIDKRDYAYGKTGSVIGIIGPAAKVQLHEVAMGEPYKIVFLLRRLERVD